MLPADTDKRGNKKILGYFLVFTGIFFFSFFIFFFIANYHHELSGGSWFAIEDFIIMMGLSASVILAIVGLNILNKLKKIILAKSTINLLLAGVFFALGFFSFVLFRKLVYSNPKNAAIQVAKASQEDLFYPALLNTGWIKDKIPLYFARNTEMRVINTDGTDEKIILGGKGRIDDFIISPDANYILVLASQASSGLADLYLASLKSNEINLIDSNIWTAIGSTQWSWNGKKFIYVPGGSGICIFDVESKTKNIVTSPAIEKGGDAILAMTFRWSKQDDAIYFSGWGRVNESPYKAHYEIQLSNLKVNEIKSSTEENIILRWNQIDSTERAYFYGVVDAEKLHKPRIISQQRTQYYQHGGMIRDFYYISKDATKKKLFSEFVPRWTVFNPKAAPTPNGEYVALLKPKSDQEGLFIYETSSERIGRLLSYPDISMIAFYAKDEN